MNILNLSISVLFLNVYDIPKDKELCVGSLLLSYLLLHITGFLNVMKKRLQLPLSFVSLHLLVW